MNNTVKIRNNNGKYIVDANIHTEIETNDIAKVQEEFASDCAYYFAEQIRYAINTRDALENLWWNEEKSWT